MLQGALSSVSPSSNVGRELLWEKVIQEVICLIHEAERRIKAAPEQYHSLEGWWRDKAATLSKGRKALVPTEEAISEAIVEEIEKLREEIILKTHPMPEGFSHIGDLQFAVEVPRKKKKGIGKFSKPTDIRVYKIGSEILDLRIEAKVLINDKEINKVYLSNSGLKRFSDPMEPYTAQEIGGMLAYTVTDNRISWRDKIEASIGCSSPPIPSFKYRLHHTLDETLFCRVPYKSENKQGRTEVIVFHTILEFNSDPSGR